jgi:hypothetical protein
MSISFFLLLLGIIFIITGYTHQVTPSCDKGTKLKLVNREEFNKMNNNGGINNSHMGSPI